MNVQVLYKPLQQYDSIMSLIIKHSYQFAVIRPITGSRGGRSIIDSLPLFGSSSPDTPMITPITATAATAAPPIIKVAFY